MNIHRQGDNERRGGDRSFEVLEVSKVGGTPLWEKGGNGVKTVPKPKENKTVGNAIGKKRRRKKRLEKKVGQKLNPRGNLFRLKRKLIEKRGEKGN